jgi:hypothetical protein
MQDNTTVQDPQVQEPNLQTPEEIKKPEVSDKDTNFANLRKKLNDTDKKLAETEAKLKAKEEKELEETGKFKELAEIKTKEAEEVKTKYLEKIKQTQIQSELLKSGVNPEYQDLFTQQFSTLKVNEEGEIEGLSEKLSEVKAKYPLMFSSVQMAGNVGISASTTSNTSTISKQKALEIIESGDNALYQKHQKDILQAINS